jgi:NADPH:quinone reductase-like Zn-dependent oxidoreductase
VKAIIHDNYGPIESLERRDIEPPTIGDHEVLVRVEAAAVHIGDVFAVWGRPLLVRTATGLRRPTYGVPGLDLAGTVEAIGRGVTRLAVGDEVFGEGAGTAAELARAGEDKLVRKPAGFNWADAAAITTSGSAALHGLRDAGRLEAGQRVLIVGASGGVGTFAVQIAKAMGAHVTGVTSAKNAELVGTLGADEVIDYTRDDFTERRGAFDLIFDNIEDRPLSAVRRALTPKGTLVLNSGTGSSGLRMVIRLVRPLVLSPFSSQTMRRYLSNANHEDLDVLKGMVEAGQIKPVIGRTYPLDDTVEALRYVATGHARGKVVLAV